MRTLLEQAEEHAKEMTRALIKTAREDALRDFIIWAEARAAESKGERANTFLDCIVYASSRIATRKQK